MFWKFNFIYHPTINGSGNIIILFMCKEQVREVNKFVKSTNIKLSVSTYKLNRENITVAC